MDRPHVPGRLRRRRVLVAVLAAVSALSSPVGAESQSRPEEPLVALLAVLPEDPRAGITVLADGRWSRRAGATLKKSEEREVLDALSRVPRRSLLDALTEIAAEPSDARLAPAALRVLVHAGDSRGLELLAPLALAGLGDERPDRDRRALFADSLRALLLRDPACVSRVPALARGAHAGLFAEWVREVARVETEGALLALGDLVHVAPGGEILVLGELARSARRQPHPLGVDLAPALRRALDRDDPVIVTAAVDAVGAAEVRELVPDLARMLDHADDRVARASLQVLQAFSGRQIGRDAEAWRAWHAAELRWWERAAPRVLDDARHAAPGVATHRILELSLRRFHRHALAGPLARCLRRSEEDVVVMTIHALGHLGSHGSVQPLIPMLEDGRVEVIKAAWHALKRITGESLGPDADAWRKRFPA